MQCADIGFAAASVAAGTARPEGDHPPRWQWAALRCSRWPFALALQRVHLSAAWLLGPMAAAIALAAAGATVRVPRVPFFVAQGVVGCLIIGPTAPSAR